MPFPHDGRVVAAVLEDIRDRRPLGVYDELRGDRGRSPHASAAVGAERIFPGKQCVTRGRADGRYRMRIRKPASFRGKPVDVGCLHFGRAIASKVTVAEIIGKDQNDIGRLFGGERRTSHQEEQK